MTRAGLLLLPSILNVTIVASSTRSTAPCLLVPRRRRSLVIVIVVVLVLVMLAGPLPRILLGSIPVMLSPSPLMMVVGPGVVAVLIGSVHVPTSATVMGGMCIRPVLLLVPFAPAFYPAHAQTRHQTFCRTGLVARGGLR